MSASLAVDLGQTCSYIPSLQSGNGVSGQVCGLSGQYVGQSVFLGNTNTYCNIWIQANPVVPSGNLIVGIQTADADVSGSYGDPTSGLQTFPGNVQSGGNIWINSGSTGGIFQSGGSSGAYFQSGFIQFVAFQRPQTYARLVFQSGFYLGTFSAGFISQNRTTGSGGGFVYSPSSGVVNV